jgi:hypothetical protein
MTNKRSMLCAALLAGGSMLAANAAYAQPNNNPKPASPPSHDMHGPAMHHPWHPGVNGWHGPAFRFHVRDFRHFTPAEHAMWVHGNWRHRWWHGRWSWFWLTGGGAYFYPAPVYPYPGYVSETVVDEGPDTDEGPAYNSGPQGGGNGTWYYCANPKGYYPYIPQCSSDWQPVPATPPGMSGGPDDRDMGPDNGPPGGPDDDMGPPGGPDDRDMGPGNGHGPDDQMGPPNGRDDRDMGPDNGPPDESGPPPDGPPDDNGYPPDNGPPR